MFRKNFKILTVSILCVIIVLAGVFLSFRFRNSTSLKPEGRDDLTLCAMHFRQDDVAWAKEKLGTSSYTMKSSGCLTTCIASALNISPYELNTIFSETNVYDINGNIQWDAIRNLGYSVDVYSKVSEDDIYSILQEGHFPIVRVRVNTIGNFHYVLITGIEKNDYTCMDPLEDFPTKLSQYGNMIYALRAVYTP